MSIKTNIHFHTIGINDLLRVNRTAIGQLSKQMIYVLIEKSINDFIIDNANCDVKRLDIEKTLRNTLGLKVEEEIDVLFDEIKTVLTDQVARDLETIDMKVTKLEYDTDGQLIDVGIDLRSVV